MSSPRFRQLEDYELALSAMEQEIVELEDALDEQSALNQALRERLAFVERDLARRRKHSNTITIIGATPHAR